MSSAEIDSPITSSGESGVSSAAEGAVNAGRQAASKAGRQVKRQAESLYEDASSTAAATANETSDVVDDAADALDKSGHETLGRAAAALSERMRSFSAYLEDIKLEDLLRDAQRLAQRNPALMIGGGVALGFLLSRFFKASAGASRRQS